MDQSGNIDTVDLYDGVYGDAGRPEDLADLAPELVALLRECLPYANKDTATNARAILARAERAK